TLLQAITSARLRGGKLHLIGLLGSGGVHSHDHHLLCPAQTGRTGKNKHSDSCPDRWTGYFSRQCRRIYQKAAKLRGCTRWYDCYCEWSLLCDG
ncbi:MAG: hypothetical protein K8I82_15265, partial [Anaerolineae bacterium]|nr:hypothetical protein [Anaerolineae bacterium]